MNVLLLGATGYLGGNIAAKLVDEGHHVICVVRSTSDFSRLDMMGNNIELISSSVDQIELTLKRGKVDWVINAVCTYKPNETLYGDMLNSNVMFPLSVLNLAVKYHVSNFLTIGTGLPDDFNVYSFTKHSLSEFGHFISLKEKINFIDLQLEMFYSGMFEPSNRFLKDCFLRLSRGEKVQLTEGNQRRDIIRVEDVVAIISLLVDKNIFAGYNLLPLGSGEQHSIRDILTFMKDYMKSPSELDFGAIKSRENEPDTCADIKWLNKINYTLEYGYWEGLEEYCKRKDR